jgi:polyisoprenoid-binding protein YceI
MSRMTFRCLSIAAALLCALSATPARADGYKLDSGHSSLIFKVKHLDLNYFYGRFNAIEGELTFDAKAPTKAKVKVTAKTDSVDTNSAGRDGHLKGAAALAAEEHPLVTFESTSVAVAGEGTFRLKGNLTFRGITRPVEATAVQLGISVDEKGGGKVGFEVKLSFRRSEFGMTGMGMISDQVDIIAGLEWNRVPPAAKNDSEE